VKVYPPVGKASAKRRRGEVERGAERRRGSKFQLRCLCERRK